MTNPFQQQQQVPAAQRPWVQQPGGYDPGGQQGQQQQVQPLMPSQMQQQQPVQQLPPQMQQPQQSLLQDSQSPLAGMQPVMPQYQQRQQQPVQQQPVQQNQGQQQFPPQGQQFQPNQSQSVPVNVNDMVLQGPGVPAELQGRRMSEVVNIYNGLRQTHLQQMVQQPQQQQPQFQQPVPQQQQQVQQQPTQQRGWNWQRPDESVGAIVEDRLNHMVESRLMPLLAPIAADRAMAAVQNARAQAAHAIGVQNFAMIEPEVMQALQGAHPSALTDPRTWQTAAAVVIGNRTMRGQPVQQPQQQQQAGPGAYPVQMVQPGQNPMPNLNTFFSEQPHQGGPGGQGIQLSQMQRAAAGAMGISEADYAAWAVGTNPRTV
jgi:hypothetical protein